MTALKVILIIIILLFVLTFVTYMTNGDGKMIEKIYNSFIKYHDNKEKNEKI